MSSESPPFPITNTYNESAWIQDTGSGLTQTKANTLYLRKTNPDLDPFLATFSAGLKTDNIDTTDLTGATNCGLFQNSTNCVIDLGPTTKPVGHSTLIRIGQANCNVTCGSGTGKFACQTIESFSGATNSLYNDLPNPLNMGLTSSAIQIGTSQSAGNSLSLGSASSVVSISNTASRTGTISIGSGNGSSGSILIGSGVSSNNTVSIANGVIGLGDEAPYVNILSGTNDSFSGGDMSLFTTSRGSLVIGGVNNTAVTFNKAPSFSTGILTNTINPVLSTSPISISPSSTAITVGTSQASTNTIGIGASGSIVSIPGATTLGSISCNSINSVTAAATVNIMSTSTGIVNLATASNRSGVCHLADGTSSTGSVHLNNGDTASGNTQVMNGASQTGNLNLGATTNSVVINVNRPLTTTYSSSAITSSSMIGYTVIDTASITMTTVPNGLNYILPALILPAGVWLIHYSLRFRSAGTSTVSTYYLYGEDNVTFALQPSALNGNDTPFVCGTSGFCGTGTFPVSSTGTTTYAIGIFIAYSGSTISVDLGLPSFGTLIKRTKIA